MARDVESLVLQMSADLRRFEKAMASMDATARKRLTSVEAQAMKSQRNLERIMARTGAGMVNGLRGSLAELAPTIAAAFSSAQVIKYADAWTSGRNALAAAGTATEDLARRQNELVDLANSTRSSTEQTIGLYRRLTIATDEMGLSQGAALRLTELLNKSFQTSGSSTQEAASAALQLSQALASGTLQGDELRSIRENAPQLAQAIARAMGVGIGELKRLGSEGKITAQVVAQAILASGDAIDARFAATTSTVSQALQVLDNQLGRYIGQSDAGLSATERAAQGIILLANNLDHVMPIVATLAVLVGGRYALAMGAAAIQTGVATVNSIAYQAALIRLQARQTGATFAQISLNTAMAANPIGLLIVAAAALSAGLVYLANRYDQAKIAQRELTASTEAATTAGDAYQRALEASATKSGKAKEEALKLAEALRIVYRDAVNAARALAQTRIAQTLSADAEASAANARAQRTANQPAMGAGGFNVVQQGNNMNAANAAQRARQARSDADAAIQAYNEQERRLTDLQSGVGLTVPGAGGGSVAEDKKGKGASGPSAAELAAQRDMLDLQAQVELLRARGREDEAKAIQRQIDVLDLTKRYEDAGFENARQKAEQQVAALAAAEQSAQRNARFEDATRAYIEDQTAQRERQAEIAADELGLRAEIARLMGDEAGVAAAQREYDIVRRTADLKAKGLSEPDAEQQATRETDQLRGAEIVGGLGDAFRDPTEQMREQYAEIDRLRQADVLSEQEAAAAKAQANAMYQEQRLANAQGFFGTLAQLQSSSNKELAAIGKAAAIAQATIDGFVAVQKALASAPPPFNFALAAAVGVVAAANVAQIAGMADGGIVRGPGGPRDDKVMRRLSNGEFVMNAQATAQNRALLEALNGGAAIKGLADGGPVSGLRVPTITIPQSRQGSQPIIYSPTVNAPGASAEAVASIQRTLAVERRNFAKNVTAVTNRGLARGKIGKPAWD